MRLLSVGADCGLLRDLYCKHVGWTKHVRAEDDPFHVRSERHIGLEAVVMFREIDEFLRFEDAWPDQILRVR